MLFNKNLDISPSLIPSPYSKNVDKFLNACVNIKDNFTDEAQQTLDDIKNARKLVSIFKNIPNNELIPNTPRDVVPSIGKIKNTFMSEGIIASVAIELGNLFAYEEQNGYLVHDIIPVKKNEFSNTGKNSKRFLSFHNDGSTHPVVTPDYVILYCLRPDSAAKNYIATVPKLLENLSSETIDYLHMPMFKHKVDDELSVESKDNFIIQPVFIKNSNIITIKYDADLTFGLDRESSFHLKKLKDAILRSAYEIKNEKNSILVINNNLCVHARSIFSPRYDGTDRWIQSAFSTKSNIKNGSIVKTEYKCQTTIRMTG